VCDHGRFVGCAGGDHVRGRNLHCVGHIIGGRNCESDDGTPDLLRALIRRSLCPTRRDLDYTGGLAMPDASSPPQSLNAPPSGFASRMATMQVQRPGLVLTIAALLTIASLLLASRLAILTGFEALLPESRPSVLELNRVAARTAGVSTLFIVLEARDTSRPAPSGSLRKAADLLVEDLQKLGPPWVGSVEDGMHDALQFFTPRAGLFGELEKLQKLKSDLDARYDWEVAKATDTSIDDDEPPPEIDPERLKESFGVTDADTERYPDGYYQSKDGRVVVVAIRSKIHGSDSGNGAEALRRIKAVVDRVNPASYDPSITYAFTGDLATGVAEYMAVHDDLTKVGYSGAILIIGVVFLYYLRLRTLVAITLTIGVGVAWTFGMTELAIGHLNLATGFLFTIVAGNGINFGIIYLARFLEARRRGSALAEAILIAHRETWLPTMTAGFAAAAAYGSLIVTEFRGFRDFGLIGGVGMLLCWVATYWTLPSILVVTERLAPLERPGILASMRGLTHGGVAYGKPFAALIPRAPRVITTLGLALAAVGVVALVLYVLRDPMEYDMRNLRNTGAMQKEASRLTLLAESITGYVGSDGMAILVDRIEDVAPLRAALNVRRDNAPSGAKPFEKVHALQDFVPPQQADKVPLLLGITDKLIRAHKRGSIKQQDWSKLSPYLPPDDLRPFAMADLPLGIARAFAESDGTRGRIVYISPTTSESIEDARYLFRWADSYRETRLPDGRIVRGSGRAVIYADMWTAIVSDVPVAVTFSFVATVLVVLIAFRAGRAAGAVLAALLVGVAWMAGMLVLLNVKLNFLNFIALPITFGIGVDYAVNIVQRYSREGVGGALTAIRETGGAVILCSLTTMLGYLALVQSMNHSVRSLGVAAVIGEVCCLLAAVLVLPAGIVWLDRGRAQSDPSIIGTKSG
jgi:predicted RND superfamily exporter protein